MSDNPYEVMMPQGPLGKAVDKAVEEANAAFLANPEAQQRAAEVGDRWRAIFEAEETAGQHGVVLPMALAEDLLKILDGEEARLPRRLLVDSLAQRTQQAQRRA